MLVLTVLMTIALLVQQSSSINLTYIVKKEGQKLQPNCIAEEQERYSAIGWIYPLPANGEKEPNIVNKFIPTIQNDYNCKFGKADKCNKIWALKNWQIDENSTRTLQPIFDTRWEDLPTFYTGKDAKEFDEKIEIPNIFNIAFSVRASDSIEVLLCDGWKPYTYPCYHLNISRNTILLRKYMTLPENISASDKFVDSYTAFANILSGDEWRNFIVKLDDKGVLTLIDVNVNRTVIEYEDKEPLKPLYLLTRSEKPALWKIHQNQFFYTTTPQISRLGPQLTVQTKDMCVALYVMTCPSCMMTFFAVSTNNEKKFLADVNPTNFEWRLIKLKYERVLADKLNIFVETNFTTPTHETGFWAVDDVRVCHENEVKVSFLKLEDGIGEEEEVSCQIVQHPKWRPKKLVYSKIDDFPAINNSSNSTSIYLNWTQEDPNNQINYFITYEALDICPEQSPNINKIKSNGFLMTKHNELTINNLIPYTTYNITFESMLHEHSKRIAVTTQETEKPTFEEIPSRLNIQVTDNEAFVSWDKIPCGSIYGPILYAVNVTNRKTNVTKEVAVLSEDTVQISDLEPYTLFTLHITTARNFENIQKKKNIVDLESSFTTQSGKAPPVENLELYSVDEHSISLRYDLPKNAKGVPVYAQVTRCNLLSYKKCKTSNFPLTPCKLWPKKYCIDVPYLIPQQSYSFKVSVRNDGTQIYGEETKIEAYMDERVPGAPENITYKIVDCKEELDYCHLNVSWLHPYNQNGSIESFHILLNGTDGTSKSIQEVLKIANSSFYLPKYEYQVKFIPYSTRYDLYIQSVNSKYKSPYTHTQVKTDDIGDHIDQNPVLIQSHPTSVLFKLPHLDHRLKSYTLTTVVQDFNKDKIIPTKTTKNLKVGGNLCHNFGNTWILEDLVVTSADSPTLEIGSNGKNNKPLEPKTQYCVTFIVTNKYKDGEHYVVYYKKFETPQPVVGKGGYNHLYALLLLLLLIPLGFVAYRYLKKRSPRKARQTDKDKENEYESMPFEENDENCVTNETYDRLLHK